VKLFRTLSTPRLVVLVGAAAIALVGAAFAVASARGGGGATPPPKPLANAIHDALGAPEPAGITARITFTNKLFPSGALAGQAGSALMSGATGRLWVNATGGRLELQSDAGDAQIVWNNKRVTVYDATSNTAYVADLPAKSATDGTRGAPPTLDQITTFLADLAKHWTVSGAAPSSLAGEPAYTVSVSPNHDGGLLGSAQLAWDAARGVPLRIAVYAQGESSPVLALEATKISFGAVPEADIAVSPPAGANVVDLSTQAGTGAGTGGAPGKGGGAPVTGLAAVQAAAPFAVVAPDTLVGLPRRDVRLVGPPPDGRSVLAVYGQGLGAVVVVEREHDAGKSPGGETLGMLPSVSLDGVTAHELSTQLGTVLTWDRAGVSYILAGSIPPAAAESAARSLR
jgi:outer membrane lipoprotein-sorting protein